MRVTNNKNCYCYTCKKEFHFLGIARHRAMHRDKKEKCRIGYTYGDIYEWDYTAEKKEGMEVSGG